MKIYQISYSSKMKSNKYRRYKLFKWLTEKGYEVEWYTHDSSSYKMFAQLEKDNSGIVLFSDGRTAMDIKAIKERTGCKVMYDCTDYWTQIRSEDNISIVKNEREIIDSADIITCSSLPLQKILKNRYSVEAEYIPNGCTVTEYKPQMKRNSVIILGTSLRKWDTTLLYKLCKENPDVNFDVYGINANSSIYNLYYYPEITETQIQEVVPYYKAGLILLNNDIFNRGMLPLKLFNYINGRIPTAYHNCSACKDFSDVAFDLDAYSLTEIMNKEISLEKYNAILNKHDWNKIFTQIENKIKILSGD